MLRKIVYGLAALGVVLVCSVEARAQQHSQRGQTVVNRTVVNQQTTVVQNGGYRGGYGRHHHYHGNDWVGPAVGGLALGVVAGVLIDRATQPAPVVVSPGYVAAPPPRDCITAVSGYDRYGNPIYGTYCR